LPSTNLAGKLDPPGSERVVRTVIDDDVQRVRVTESQVAAAQLEIELLEELGRPVDNWLRVLAMARPAAEPVPIHHRQSQDLPDTDHADADDDMSPMSAGTSTGKPPVKPSSPAVRMYVDEADHVVAVAVSTQVSATPTITGTSPGPTVVQLSDAEAQELSRWIDAQEGDWMLPLGGGDTDGRKRRSAATEDPPDQ
jgi:hypothetical protein